MDGGSHRQHLNVARLPEISLTMKNHHPAHEWPYFFILAGLLLSSLLSPNDIWAQGKSYWKAVQKFQNTEIFSIDCASPNDCMMATTISLGWQGSIVYQSTDGGTTWKESFVNPPIEDTKNHRPLKPYILQHPSRDFAVAGCDSGIILRTTDGGARWERQRIAAAGNVCEHLSMYDRNHGIAAFAGHGTPVFITSNGGERWRQISLPWPADSAWEVSSRYYPYNVACVAPGTFICVVRGPKTHAFFHSSDNGERWTLTNSLFGPDNDTVRFSHTFFSFIDTLNGFVASSASLLPLQEGVGRRTVLSRTSDGGRTWNVVFQGTLGGDPIWEDPKSPAFSDTLHGTLAGFYGIYSTADGGRTWRIDSCQVYPVANPAITFRNGHPGLAAIYTGDVLVRTALPSSAGNSRQLTSWQISSLQLAENRLAVVQNLPAHAIVSLSLHDLLGNTVVSLPATPFEAGVYETTIDLSSCPSGRYILRLWNGQEQRIAAVTLVR